MINPSVIPSPLLLEIEERLNGVQEGLEKVIHLFSEIREHHDRHLEPEYKEWREDYERILL